MPEWIVPALLALNLLLLLFIALRRSADNSAAMIERLERELRDELGRQGQTTRSDLGTFQQILLTQSGDVARTQNEQIDGFRTQLATTQQQTEAALRRFSETLGEQLRGLSEANERRLGDVRQAVDARLQSLQEGNERKLDQRSMAPLPPATSENPSTSSRLPVTDPVNEPRTTSVSPSRTAIRAMISSGALPKVALRKPPMPGPVCSAACSVASPISQASGIRAMAESTKSAVSPSSVR